MNRTVKRRRRNSLVKGLFSRRSFLAGGKTLVQSGHVAPNCGMQIKLLREGWVNLESRMAIFSLEDLFDVMNINDYSRNLQELSFTTQRRRNFRGVPFPTAKDILRTEI